MTIFFKTTILEQSFHERQCLCSCGSSESSYCCSDIIYLNTPELVGSSVSFFSTNCSRRQWLGTKGWSDIFPVTQSTTSKHWRKQGPNHQFNLVLFSPTTRLLMKGHCSLRADSQTPIAGNSGLW